MEFGAYGLVGLVEMVLGLEKMMVYLYDRERERGLLLVRSRCWKINLRMFRVGEGGRDGGEGEEGREGEGGDRNEGGVWWLFKRLFFYWIYIF